MRALAIVFIAIRDVGAAMPLLPRGEYDDSAGNVFR